MDQSPYRPSGFETGQFNSEPDWNGFPMEGIDWNDFTIDFHHDSPFPASSVQGDEAGLDSTSQNSSVLPEVITTSSTVDPKLLFTHVDSPRHLTHEVIRDLPSELSLLDSGSDLPNQVQHDSTPLDKQNSSVSSLPETIVTSSTVASSTGSAPISSDPDDRCTCIHCSKIGIHFSAFEAEFFRELHCRIPDCEFVFVYYNVTKLLQHEKTHFQENDEKYHCRADRCTSVSKRWDELVRHTTTKHCLNPPKFHCSVVDCPYHTGAGFKRKDNLKSHYKTIHQGRPTLTRSAQPLRIAPRP